MAALPEFRGRESFPFSKVGVDFAGPLFVKSKIGESKKAYIALFSCCVTRAVHLELVEDLTSQTFRRALRRFSSRRSTPALIISDNAKTFRATQKALKQLFNHPEVRSELERTKTEWRFNLVGRIFRTPCGMREGMFKKGTRQCKTDKRLTNY